MQKKIVEHKLDFVLSLLEEHGFEEPYNIPIPIIKKTFADDNPICEKTFLELLSWLDSFTNRKRAFSSFSSLWNKIDDKDRFLELFLNSPTLRSCLTYIFSYPYLDDILFYNPHFVFFILSDLDTEDREIERGEYFYSKSYLLKSLLGFLGVRTEAEAIKKVTFNLFLQFKRMHILRIASFNGIGRYSLEDLGNALSNLADFIFDFVLKREKLKLSNLADINISILASGRFALRTVSYTDSYKVLFVYGDYAGTNNISQTHYYNYCKLLVQRVVDFLNPRRGDVLYSLSFYRESSKSSYPIIYRSSQYIAHLENSQTILGRYNLLNIRFSAGDYNTADGLIKGLMPLIYRRHLSLIELKSFKSVITNIFESFDKRPILTIEKMLNLLHLLYADKAKVRCSPFDMGFLFASNTLMIDEERISIKKSYIFLKELKNQRELCNLKDWSFFFDEFDRIEENQFALAVCLSNIGVESGDNLKAQLILRFEDIIYRSRSIFKNYIKDFVDNRSYLLFLLYQDDEDKGMIEFLESYGFLKPRRAISLLREILPYSERARESFGETLLLFFNSVSLNKIFGLDVDSALVYFVNVVQSYKAHETLFDLFVLQPFFLKRLLNIFSNSSFLSEIIISYPEFMEHLSDKSFLDKPNSMQSLDILFKSFLTFKTFKEAIIHLKNYESLRIGARHMFSPGEIKGIGYELSNLAEFILIRSFKYFYNELVKERAYSPLDYAIVFLGKLGGREVSFGSDIDIYLVYGDDRDRDTVVGAKSKGYNNTYLFYNELISRLNTFFSLPSVTGMLYELDLKLRPEGRNSPLTVSFNKMRDYLQSSKEVVWERLVYTKARVFSPNPSFKKKVDGLIGDFVSSFASLECEQVKKEVLYMRDRVASNAIKKSVPFNFFKKGRGGLLDIEFLVEYLIIDYRSQGGFSTSTNLFDMLLDLHTAEVIDDDSYILFEGALLFFRNIELVLRINTNTGVEELPASDTKEFLRLIYRLNFKEGSEFLQYYSALVTKLRDIFNNYFR